VFRQRIKHERVVRIGRVTKGQNSVSHGEVAK
jgi:hypothetical protein